MECGGWGETAPRKAAPREMALRAVGLRVAPICGPTLQPYGFGGGTRYYRLEYGRGPRRESNPGYASTRVDEVSETSSAGNNQMHSAVSEKKESPMPAAMSGLSNP